MKQLLESELDRVLERIRRMDCGTASEPLLTGMWKAPTLEDQLDAGLLNSEREMNFAGRSLLIEKAQRLARALERLGRGEYGPCQECGEFIGLRRLRVMPEVTTCVRCQEVLERRSRRGEIAGRA